MRKALQRLLGPRMPAKQREALLKRAIERILLEEGMPKAARTRAASRIFEVLHDEQR